MKEKIIILLSFVALFGCDAYLDETPDNRQTVTTLQDVSELLVSGYSNAAYHYIEWKSDNSVEIKDNTQFNWMTENFSYEPVVSEEDQDTPTYLWNENYAAISHANQALEELDKIESKDTDFADALRGEALMSRAYNHFILASVFCLHYSETNKTSLGLPYITKPETELIATYERGTLEETYNLIEKDMLEALSLISNDYYIGTGKYHFNRNAALAVASRFYLFKQDYEKSIEYSNQIVGAGASTTAYVRNYTDIYVGSSVDRSVNFIDVNLPSNLLVVRKESVYHRVTRGYRLSVPLFFAIFRDNKIQTGSDRRLSGYTQGTSAVLLPKYNELFQYTTATTGNPYLIIPVLRSEEVLLNRIESYAHLNQLDKALEYYNAIAGYWYTDGGQLTQAEITAFFGGTDQEAMIKFIAEERRKEFLYEGLRWFDIKRLELEINHVISTDNNGEILEEVTLTGNDLRKAEQIPTAAISNGIEANPR